jgi:hypothetical protein
VVNDESKTTGFRYYQGAWYLLVYTDPKLGKVGKLHFLPDQTAKMSATPFNFWASLEGTLDFENGVLTKSRAVGDETVVPKAVLTVAKEIIGALVDAPPVDVSRSSPELYKITILGKTAEIKSKSGIRTVPLEVPPDVPLEV